MNKGIDRDMSIGALVADLSNRCINAVSKIIGISRWKVKKCSDLYQNRIIQLSFEFRGRKSIEEKYPNLKRDIEIIIEKYKNVDAHFKNERLYVSVSPQTIIDELITNSNYPVRFACYNTIAKLLKEMGYKLKRISKELVQDKIPETDAIFENVNNAMESAMETNDSVAVISIDDKATKKIGNLSDGGKSWLNLKALDHDTKFE